MELMEPHGNATTAVDVFSLGCVFAYVLSDGNHPYGQRFHRKHNIFLGNYDLNILSDISARQMIESMIQKQAEKRCNLSAVISHAYFKRHPDFYELKGSKPGLCIIINQRTFEDMPERNGTDVDRDSLEKTFKMFDFEIEIRENVMRTELFQYFLDVSKRNLDDYQCLVVCLLSHGEEGAIYDKNDRKIDISTITSYFNGNSCPSLTGKPKLFFIAACQGSLIQLGARNPECSLSPAGASPSAFSYAPDGNDGSSTIVEHEVGAENTLKTEVSDLPDRTDILEVYSTVEGYKSFRDMRNGTIFIQSLCQMLQQDGHKEDLMNVLHKVNNLIAQWSPGMGWKQMPQIRSSLRMKLLFNRREDSFVDAATNQIERIVLKK